MTFIILSSYFTCTVEHLATLHCFNFIKPRENTWTSVLNVREGKRRDLITYYTALKYVFSSTKFNVLHTNIRKFHNGDEI